MRRRSASCTFAFRCAPLVFGDFVTGIEPRKRDAGRLGGSDRGGAHHGERAAQRCLETTLCADQNLPAADSSRMTRTERANQKARQTSVSAFAPLRTLGIAIAPPSWTYPRANVRCTMWDEKAASSGPIAAIGIRTSELVSPE